jgi:phage antirepressor YoqD-like protein
MTIREVADILGVTGEALKKHIRDLWPDLMKNGIQTCLTEYHVTAIKTKMIPTTKVVAATTDLEMMILDKKVAEWKSRKIEELTKQLEEVKPKAQLADRMLNTGNLRTITDFGKIIAKPRKIFSDLIEKAILFRRDSDQVLFPYQKYIDTGFFEVRYNIVKIGDREERKPQTYITAKGEQWLASTLYAPRLPL